MDLEALVRAAAAGDLDAFAELTRRFQHMAFGYALSFVRDLGQAEDVVQEAFVAAWYALPTLADPTAFAGWLRGIVRYRAHRVLRRKHLESVPLTRADTVAADEPAADRRIERRQQVGAVLAAIAAMPRPLREVVTLYYVHDCSHQDIATFLGIPVTTVNNRLHAARAQLKRRTLTMVKDTLEAHRLPDDFAARIGHIVSARDGVVDARFDPVSLPDFLTELVASDEAHQRAVSLQVVQRLPDGIVRCIVTSPADALEPGMTVLSAGRHVQKPVSREVFDRSVRLLAGPSASPDAPVEMLATGIKVIDVMCPLVRGGTVAIAGELRFLVECGPFLRDAQRVAADAKFRVHAREHGGGWRLPGGEGQLDLWGLKPGVARDFVRERLCDFSLCCFEEPLRLRENHKTGIPATFVSCVAEGYPARPFFEPFARRARACGWQVKEVNTGHDCHVEQPTEIGDILLSAALGT